MTTATTPALKTVTEAGHYYGWTLTKKSQNQGENFEQFSKGGHKITVWFTPSGRVRDAYHYDGPDFVNYVSGKGKFEKLVQQFAAKTNETAAQGLIKNRITELTNEANHFSLSGNWDACNATMVKAMAVREILELLERAGA
jgi:hypothetical protein